MEAAYDKLHRKERQKHLENWMRGGLSKNAYAKAVGISPRTFTGWTWHTKENPEQNFVEIKKEKLLGYNQEMVIEKGSITVHVPLSVGMKELQTVFTALGGTQ